MRIRDMRSEIRGELCSGVLAAERLLRACGNRKSTGNLFSEDVSIPYVGSDLQITKETDDEIFLEKKSGGSFRILSTTDLHMMSNPYKDAKTVDLLLRNVKELKPDLLILTGDIFTTDHPIIDAVQFAQMMEKTGIYWCWVFGNHECREDFSIFKYSMMQCTAKYPHCLSRVGKSDLFGVGNYAINLMQGERLIRTLFLFDSGRDILDKYRESEGCPQELTGYDFLKKSQIEWYKRLSALHRYVYKTNRSFVYMHIPLCEYAEAFEGENRSFQPSGKCEILYGTQHESVGCSEFNSGMFDAICQNGTDAVFVGHDHVNDFCAILNGVMLVYNQAAGYDGYDLGSYCNAPENEWQQGVTVTDIRQDGTFTVFGEKNARFLNR